MFRPFRLLSLAAQAETLRWKRMGKGYAYMAIYGAVAAVFALLLLVMLHIAAYSALQPWQSPTVAALIVAAFDLVVAGILGFLASRSSHDPVQQEALLVRDNALRQVGDLASRAAIAAPLLRSQKTKKGLLGAAVTAAVVGLLARR